MTQKILRTVFGILRSVVSIYSSSIECNGTSNKYNINTAQSVDIYSCNILFILSLLSFQFEWLDTFEGNHFAIKHLFDMKQVIENTSVNISTSPLRISIAFYDCPSVRETIPEKTWFYYHRIPLGTLDKAIIKLGPRKPNEKKIYGIW